MTTRKRKVVLHRIAKTEIKNYTTPEKTILRDIHITIEPEKHNWFTAPMTYPRWEVILIIGLLFAFLLLGVG
jgi:hypothetical protein